ncbi:unnamed protein product [Echinostoma caproni]|uniref:Autophagy-related protein 9 n=1 Tax=Echinostoma caproni TaxID=27848 RepID=A0A183AKU1_9TREM|nr:unnamed protein product [Echinostoma caproni]
MEGLRDAAQMDLSTEDAENLLNDSDLSEDMNGVANDLLTVREKRSLTLDSYMCYRTNNGILFAKTHLKRWTFQIVANGTVAVDTFFLMSFTPIYLAVIVLYTGFFMHLWDGPFYPQRAELSDIQYCQTHWWTMYVNNLVYTDEMLKISVYGVTKAIKLLSSEMLNGFPYILPKFFKIG